MPVEIKINGKKAHNINELFKNAETISERINNRIIMAVQAACLRIVTRARTLPSPPETLRHTPHQPNYIDDTGVLRQSIGFAIYNKGVKVVSDFQQGEGGSKAVAVADTAAARFPNEICAIIVAGADYAALVESKGYFVLSEPVSHLNDELLQYLRQIKI